MPKRRKAPKTPVIDLIGEVWKPVPGYPGYHVSNKGRVKSDLRRGVDHAVLLLQIPCRDYLRVSLMYTEDGKRKFRKEYIHKLVLLAFCGPAKPNQVCRHIDGNPHNNAFNNLKWGTQRENAEDKRRHGTLRKGDSHPNVLLSSSQVKEVWKLLHTTTYSYPKIGRVFGVSRHVIGRIAQGHAWSHLTEKLPKEYPEESGE